MQKKYVLRVMNKTKIIFFLLGFLGVQLAMLVKFTLVDEIKFSRAINDIVLLQSGVNIHNRKILDPWGDEYKHFLCDSNNKKYYYSLGDSGAHSIITHNSFFWSWCLFKNKSLSYLYVAIFATFSALVFFLGFCGQVRMARD